MALTFAIEGGMIKMTSDSDLIAYPLYVHPTDIGIALEANDIVSVRDYKTGIGMVSTVYTDFTVPDGTGAGSAEALADLLANIVPV